MAKKGNIAIEARGVSKNYGATQALKSANFQAESGKVTVLFGENGAGKSTMMKILAGIEQPTSGEIYVFGEKVSINSPAQAQTYGITIIHQELSLCPNLSVRDNIFMGRENLKRGFMNYAHEEEVTRQVLKQLEEIIDPKTKVEYFTLLKSLPFKEKLSKEKIELAKKYAYHFFFRRSIEISSLAHTPDLWPNFNIKSDFYHDLIEKKDKGLDKICRSIIDGSPIVYNDEDYLS
jgi:ABC-type sugar transport system ATPase subunit